MLSVHTYHLMSEILLTGPLDTNPIETRDTIYADRINRSAAKIFDLYPLAVQEGNLGVIRALAHNLFSGLAAHPDFADSAGYDSFSLCGRTERLLGPDVHHTLPIDTILFATDPDNGLLGRPIDNLRALLPVVKTI